MEAIREFDPFNACEIMDYMPGYTRLSIAAKDKFEFVLPREMFDRPFKFWFENFDEIAALYHKELPLLWQGYFEWPEEKQFLLKLEPGNTIFVHFHGNLSLRIISARSMNPSLFCSYYTEKNIPVQEFLYMSSGDSPKLFKIAFRYQTTVADKCFTVDEPRYAGYTFLYVGVQLSGFSRFGPCDVETPEQALKLVRESFLLRFLESFPVLFPQGRLDLS